MLRNLIVRFWNDESGAIIATEYLMLGSVVAVGGVTGMTAVRDSVNDEYKEFGNTVREVRQSYSVPMKKGGAMANRTDSAVDPLYAPVSSTHPAQITFSSP